MAHRNIVDDSKWAEVMFINGYAVFMGYLMMGVRGLGVLVLTWTTVVLLGGFVSVLGKKDFWCLTVITLVQTAGVFNIVLEETISDFVHSWWGLLGTAAATVIKPFRKTYVISDSRYYLAFLISGIQALVLVIILCPVAVLYVFGIYISAGAGLSRLIQHDFGNADGSPNLKPALQVLYSLAAAQGVLYGYKTVHAYGAKVGLAEFVAEEVLFMDKDLVSTYLKDTVEVCEKDPSFGTGRNLVTYAVELMLGTKSNGSFIDGVKILGAAIVGEPDRQVLAKHLLTRPSSFFPQMIQRLLETMGPSSPYNGEIRGHAAAILSVVASSIHLEEHPRWINCISSLLETFEEYSWQPEKYERDSYLPEDYERSWLLANYEVTYWLFKADKKKSRINYTTTLKGRKRRDYLRLVQKGLSILGNLSVHQDNCRVIIDTEGLLPKIMAPLKSEQMLRDDRHVWHAIARESYNVLKQLAVIPGLMGTKIRGEISRSREAIITTLECILECLDCDTELKISTVDIVLHLSVDTSSIKTSGSCGRIFTWIVQLIYHIPYDVENESIIKKTSISRHSSRLADQEILSWNQELPLQQSVGYVFRDLTAALVSDENISTKRVQAAKILLFLVFWYKKDDEFLKELKKTMVSVMLEVLKEILGRGSTGEADMEMGGVSGEGEGREQASSSQQQAGDEIGDIERLRKELTRLCRSIKLRWYKTDPDKVTRELDAIAEKICSEQWKPGKTFKELVEEQVKKYRL